MIDKQTGKLTLENVTLKYGSRTVIRDISLTTVPGQMLGIVGPNGSGKSTLIKGITKLIKPAKGQIYIDGQNISKMSPGNLAKMVAVVPQAPLLPNAFTALEIVLMGRTPHLGFLRNERHSDLEIAREAMQLTHVWNLAHRRIAELSGGEIQRVTIARALTQQPEIILLDEPTAYLDISFQIETLDLISGLCAQKGLTAVSTLHDLNLASQYCDRVIMLCDGCIYADGKPADVIIPENVKHVYSVDVHISPHPLNELPATLITAGGNRK
ncbi:ABC transporter ATP-binding protein [Chloroflexota bacterium]